MIRKAIIPVAGRGTRLMPIASVIPKAMFSLVDKCGTIRSILHIILEEVKSAGIEQVAIVVSPGQIEILQKYFTFVRQSGLGNLPDDIEYITQTSPKGFGDAVLQGKDFIGNEPFVLLLGDHIYIEDHDMPPCPAQVINAFDSMNGVAMIGMQPVSMKELSKVGSAKGVHVAHNIYRCTDFIEKPDLQTARKRLVTEGLPVDTFLAHCGIYAFSSEIFDCLSEVVATAKQKGKEVELAEAQTMLLKKYPEEYFLYAINGSAYDIGTPSGYADTQKAFGSNSE